MILCFYSSIKYTSGGKPELVNPGSIQSHYLKEIQHQVHQNLFCVLSITQVFPYTSYTINNEHKSSTIRCSMWVEYIGWILNIALVINFKTDIIFDGLGFQKITQHRKVIYLRVLFNGRSCEKNFIKKHLNTQKKKQGCFRFNGLNEGAR